MLIVVCRGHCPKNSTNSAVKAAKGIYYEHRQLIASNFLLITIQEHYLKPTKQNNRRKKLYSRLAENIGRFRGQVVFAEALRPLLPPSLLALEDEMAGYRSMLLQHSFLYFLSLCCKEQQKSLPLTILDARAAHKNFLFQCLRCHISVKVATHKPQEYQALESAAMERFGATFQVISYPQADGILKTPGMIADLDGYCAFSGSEQADVLQTAPCPEFEKIPDVQTIVFTTIGTFSACGNTASHIQQVRLIPPGTALVLDYQDENLALYDHIIPDDVEKSRFLNGIFRFCPKERMTVMPNLYELYATKGLVFQQGHGIKPVSWNILKNAFCKTGKQADNKTK